MSTVPVTSVERLVLMKPQPSQVIPDGLAIMTAAFFPATSTMPFNWLGLDDATSFKMTLALPCDIFALPLTLPASVVLLLPAPLLSTTPALLTSNCL